MRSTPDQARAFSLIELVIVVVILAVIAVPRFSSAAETSRVSRLFSDQRALQTAIDRYDAEHTIPIGQRGGNKVATGLMVARRLTEFTNEQGGTDGSAIFGPYLRELPANSINGRATLTVSHIAAVLPVHGWRLDPNTSRVTPGVMGGNPVSLGPFADSGHVVDTSTGSVVLNGSYTHIGGESGVR